MRLLLHIGLNKCASTFIQHRLAANRATLAEAGVCYPVGDGRPAHYGLSAHYGFGPEEVPGLPLGPLVQEARQSGARAVILSSEYLSLARPKAIAALSAELQAARVELEVLLFVRPIEPWVRSLFNQYVKTVEGGRWLHGIDAFVDQVLKNRAIDVAARYRAWQQVVGAERLRLLDIAEDDPPAAVLAPFERFAGTALAAPGPEGENSSLSPGALYLTGLLLRAPSSRARDRALDAARRAGHWLPVPRRYLQIDPERRARLEREIATPLAALPRAAPVDVPVEKPVDAAVELSG